MINGLTILGIIPARGGSKGIPGKNLKILGGKPLMAWTIEEAQKSCYIDRLILSSEDPAIIRAAGEWGCETPFIRPGELAQDDTPGMEVVIHAIDNIEEKFDYVLLLQPTSPLRKVRDIDECIESCIMAGAPACVSVCAAVQHPCWMHTLDEENRLRPLLPAGNTLYRRQDLPVVYVENGAVYLAETGYLMKERGFIGRETLAYVMPVERSVDIDHETDFIYCQVMMTLNTRE